MKIFYKNILSILTLFIFVILNVSTFNITNDESLIKQANIYEYKNVVIDDVNYIITSSHDVLIGDVVTSGRLSREAFDNLVIFADMDYREIAIAVENAITDYAIRTNRRHLSGYNFDIYVIDDRDFSIPSNGADVSGVYIFINRIPSNVSMTGDALFRFDVKLDIGQVYKDMAAFEISEQLAMAMANLDIDNLVYDNFDIRVYDVNTLNLDVRIYRQPINYVFTGEASNALNELVISSLYKDMTNEEIYKLVNTAIDTNNVLWFSSNAINLRVQNEHTNEVSLEFSHINRNITLSGDFFTEYTLTSEDFNLNMTMNNDDIDNEVLIVIESYYGYITHLLFDILFNGNNIKLDINFRRTRIYIDLNLESDEIFELDFLPYILGDNVYYCLSRREFYIDARFGLMLSSVLSTASINSLAHSNPSFNYTDGIINQEIIEGVKVSWGDLIYFDIKITIWTESEYLREQFSQHGNLVRTEYFDSEAIIKEFSLPFGTQPQVFIDKILNDLALEHEFMETQLFVSENILNDYSGEFEERIRRVHTEGVLIADVTGYLSIDFNSHYVTLQFIQGDDKIEIFSLVRFNQDIYALLAMFTGFFYYSNPGFAIDAWRIYDENDNLMQIVYKNMLMPNHDIIARAVYRDLDQYTITIVFDEDIEVEVSFQGVHQLVTDNTFSLSVYENSLVMNALDSLTIIRRGFELVNFILDGSKLSSDFRMPENDIYLYVQWLEVIRIIYVTLNIPSNAQVPPNFNVPRIFEVSYGVNLSIAMSEFFVLDDLFTHSFNGFIFRSWIGGELFKGDYMPEFDLVAEASWIAREFTVWLFGNGGTINDVNNVELLIPFGVNLLEALAHTFDFTNDFYRLGFNFLFLEYNNNPIPTDMLMPNRNIDIRLTWTEIQYEIVFVLDGGTLPGFNGNDTVTIFMTYERFINDFLYIVIPIKDGYEFIGWLYNDHLVDHNTTFPSFISYIRLYALWEELELSNLSITITSSRGANIFNDYSYIVFNNIENVVTQQDFINLLRDLVRAYNAVDNTANSIFLGVSLRYVRGINLIDFTYNNVEILSNNSINRFIDGHIHLYTVEAHYSIYVSDNVQIRPNEDGELTGIILAPGGSHSLGDVVLPTYVQGVPVTEIADNSFAWRNVTSLVLPRYIEVIHPNAFAGIGASELVIEDLPNLRTIGNQAFTNAAATSITLRNLPSLVSIGNGSFAQWTANRTITLDNLPNINHMGIEAFGNNPHTFNLRNINPYATFQSGVVPGWHVSRINLLGDWSITPIWWPNRTAIWGNARFFNDIGTDVTSLPRPQ